MAVIPAQVRSTFHYPGCGCGTRPWCGNQIDWMWSDQSLGLPAAVRARPLRVCYYLPHHNVTGGMKMLIKHLVHLQRRGHWVMAAFRGPIGSPVLPPWAREMLTPDAERLILPHENITAVLGDVDVVMLGYFTQLVELGDATACPGAIVYWDQGHEHVFGDPTSHADWDRVFHASMHLPVSLLSVSNIVRDILAHHFARVAPVVPNAIDSSLFHPGPEPPHHPMRIAGRFPVDPTGPRRVLIVGNPGLRLKNFDTALAVLARVHRWLLDEAVRKGYATPESAASAAAAEAAALLPPAKSGAGTSKSPALPASGGTAPTSPSTGSHPKASASTPTHGSAAGAGTAATSAAAAGTAAPNPASTSSSSSKHPDIRVCSPSGIHVTWMCQVRPGAVPPGLPISLVVNPPQEDIPALYRSGFDCILFCSAYEAWGMPVLEAMASGVPVVTSRCHGVDMFASHRYNCLSAEPFDVDALARCVYAMVTRPALQATFARRAREVARRTTWPAAMSSLEAALYHVDRCIGKAQPPALSGSWSGGGGGGGAGGLPPDAAASAAGSSPGLGPAPVLSSRKPHQGPASALPASSDSASALITASGAGPPRPAIALGGAHAAPLDPTLEAVLARTKALMQTPQGQRAIASVASLPTLSTEPTVPSHLFDPSAPRPADSAAMSAFGAAHSASPGSLGPAYSVPGALPSAAAPVSGSAYPAHQAALGLGAVASSAPFLLLQQHQHQHQQQQLQMQQQHHMPHLPFRPAVPLMPGAWPPQASAAPGFVQPALFGTASGAFVSAGQGLGGAVPFAAPGAGGTVDAHR
ncbi:hypothetical protein FNF27_04014 [Cafeteria roenbergensis]|uniref:Glycosyl transferase family 1 domain-containing protein n=1 Tax=Cafeteria roenbergensis TaxID=33653 RepID=A0A5A8ECD5_CAFRO|nr:hypothetical protein FNF27_04014 [Cafeteria roenbergensis]